MAERRRSGEQSGIIVKNRSSSGCLIVRKKNEDVSAAGSSGARKVFRPKKEKKRPRMELSDYDSSDELLMPPHRSVGPETLRVCNGLSILEKGVLEESEFGRKRGRDRVERVRHNEDGLIVRTEEQSDKKRNRLDVFEFDEYDGVDEEMMMRRRPLGDSRLDIGGRRFLGSMAFGRGAIEREFESGSSRQVVVDKRKNLYFERTSSFNQGGMNRFGMDRDAGHVPISLLREKYMGDSDEPIRLQGKSGVLKVMVKKKKKLAEPMNNYDSLDVEENRSSSRIQDNVKRNAPIHPPSYLETEVFEKPGSFVRKEKNKLNSRKSLSTKKSKDEDSDSGDSYTALKLGPKRTEACKSVEEVSSENEKTPAGKLTLTGIKEGKVRRGSGTEKQKLRERIRGMLIEAGWTIDYRPRRNRDYLDAVYINPSGTAYWSIIKAYDALLKQLDDEEDEPKRVVDGSPFTPLSDEVLGQLTRKTRKKIEKEMKKKQRDGSQRLSTREATSRRNLGARHDEDSMDSSNHEEKLSSFLKQGGKSAKGRMNENGVVSQSSKVQSSTHQLHDSDGKPSSVSNSHPLHGRKSRKLGRCTLLVRSSNEGSNSETDGFVPYAGKRTLLSWLIDSGTVQLSEKVQYMNRRRTKILLEGWITRDGIHCGCCSKILTVSKFEIHAGSKLRQPFQNIYLDSGISLLQCQIDAWNRQEGSERIDFETVDIDGDDPNDDTCGICGDGGDLICCDGCPSTFHQSCLDIEMLPPGDWHCPNCTCKFCGVAGKDNAQGGDTTAPALLTCSICEKKYHKLCVQEMDALPVDSVTSFCGQKCRELFEHLQKYLGVKHELEAGFSWSLIHRTDEDSDTSLRGLPQTQRVECNSKLAVALTVMDECFLPIVDRRSGINLIHNVLYNSGSNFNRLNYTGFYTAILERGDEIICAASIRFHGTRLAEMPFIGTRHIYRRQGMCRRLFCALESALYSFKVEKLIIPAIAELMQTWTTVFGFTPLEESLKREMRSLNMLVFPGIDMLEKVLLEQESIRENMTAGTGSKQVEIKDNHGVAPEVANKADVDSSAVSNSHRCAGSDLLHPNVMNGEIAAADSESKCLGVSSTCTSMLNGSSLSHVSNEGTCADSQSGDKMVECSDEKSLSDSDTSHNALEKKIKPDEDSPELDITHSKKEGGIDVNVAASHEVEVPISAEETESLNSQPRDKLVESAADKSHNALEKCNKADSDSPVKGNGHFSAESDMDNAADVPATVAISHEAKIGVSVEESPDSQSRNKSFESASEKNCHTIPATSNDAMDIDSKPISDAFVENNVQSCRGGDVGDARLIDVNIGAAHEVDTAVSIEGTACSDSQLEDKLIGSASNRFSNFVKGHKKLQVGSKAVLKSSVKDDAQFCKEVDMDDAHAIDVAVATTHKVEMPVSVEGLKSAGSQLGDNLAEDSDQSCREGDTNEPKIPISVSGRTTDDPELGDKSVGSASEKERLISETIDDPVPTKQKLLLDSPSEYDSPTCRVGDCDDNFAQAKATPSPGKNIAENKSESINENPVVPLSRLDCSDVSSSDLDHHNSSLKGQNLNGSSDSGTDAAHCEDSRLQPCSNSFQNDVPEGKTESSSA